MTKFFNRYQTTAAIQWTGKNLAEVLEFTGKHPDWDRWFSSFGAYEARVKQDGDLFKVIDGPKASEARPGDWIVRNAIGYNYVMLNEDFVRTFAPVGQAAVAAALEAAAKEHDAEIVRLEAQIIENKNYLRLAGKSERSSANDFCNTAIGHHRGSAVRLRDLITPAQHDALAAHVAAEVAKARAEDAAKIAQLEQDLADANSGADDAYRRGYWAGGNGA